MYNRGPRSSAAVQISRFVRPAVWTAFLVVFAAPGGGQTVEGGFEFDGPAGTPCDSERGLPCDRTPAHLADLPDPKAWSVAGKGRDRILFRRATREELRKNRWEPGTFLLDAPKIFEAARGSRKVVVPTPLSDEKVQDVVFVLDERVEGLEFFETRAVAGSPDAVQSRVLRPVLYEYFNQGFDPRRKGIVKDAWAMMIAGDDGGIFATGLASGFEFEVAGPFQPDLDPLPAPLGLSPNPSRIITARVMSLGTFGGAQYAGCQGAFNSPACGWLCAEVIGVPCDNNPHLNPPPAHHCVDGSDNDLDGKTDFSDEECTATPGWGDDEHPGLPVRKWESGKSFALFGEGRFCTSTRIRWAAKIGFSG